ncbi:hypothetical protein A3L12_06620 [Thermococcus sp. P6]|nr:hypothetical protein A3L12_06620 [Thermococcus sp. P6]
MSVDFELMEPEELEELAVKRINEGKLKEGLKLTLRAARGYERGGKIKEAARLYRYLGYLVLEKTGDLGKARPPILKSAYLYIDLIDAEVSKPEVDVDVLDEYCSNVLEAFATLNDRKNLMKYAGEFAKIYEDLGNTYEDRDDVTMAIRTYESAHRYYSLMDDGESYKRLNEKLISLYGQLAESRLENGDVEGAAEAFYRLAGYILSIFGYDIHFMEMMDTAAKNFEKASKLSYSNGDLDGTTTNLLKAQYAYLLAKNPNRAKLIGINNARILHQVVSSYLAKSDNEKAAEKLMELTESLIGIGKLKEAIETYRSVLETESDLKFRVRVRLAVLKHHAATEGSEELLGDIATLEYHLNRGTHTKAFELAEKVMLREGLGEVLRMIHRAEGIYE